MADGTVLAGPWCMGFLDAMRLRWREWAPLLDLNRISWQAIRGLAVGVAGGRLPKLERAMLSLQCSAEGASLSQNDALVMPQLAAWWNEEAGTMVATD